MPRQIYLSIYVKVTLREHGSALHLDTKTVYGRARVKKLKALFTGIIKMKTNISLYLTYEG